MASLRTGSTRRLLVLCLGMLALAAGLAVAATSALGGSGEAPQPKPLADALHDAATGPRFDGITARVTLTSHLFDGATTEASSALMKGGTGRLWAAKGRLRLELQADSGDVQVVADQGKGFIYDASSDVAYKFDMSHPAAATRETADRAPAVADIQKKIDDVAKHAVIDGPIPAVLGGKGAYTVKLAPRGSGGLLGAAAVAWDAARGVPLRLALYARGSTTPALQLEVNDIKYGAVDPATFHLTPPAGAKVNDITGSASHPDTAAGAAHEKKEPTLATLPFALNAPPTLAGHDRASQKPAGDGAVLVYGKGLGAVVVFERKAGAADTAAAAPEASGDHAAIELPTVDLGGGTKATMISTPLGGLVAFKRGGISYTVAGSQPAGVLEAAARGL